MRQATARNTREREPRSKDRGGEMDRALRKERTRELRRVVDEHGWFPDSRGPDPYPKEVEREREMKRMPPRDRERELREREEIEMRRAHSGHPHHHHTSRNRVHPGPFGAQRRQCAAAAADSDPVSGYHAVEPAYHAACQSIDGLSDNGRTAHDRLVIRCVSGLLRRSDHHQFPAQAGCLACLMRLRNKG